MKISQDAAVRQIARNRSTNVPIHQKFGIFFNLATHMERSANILSPLREDFRLICGLYVFPFSTIVLHPECLRVHGRGKYVFFTAIIGFMTELKQLLASHDDVTDDHHNDTCDVMTSSKTSSKFHVCSSFVFLSSIQCLRIGV